MRKLARLLPLIAVAACGAPPDDAATQSDAYSQGGSLHSRFADPTKTYLPRRPIVTLQTLGALTPVQVAVAKRIDGIIANQPADGFVGLDEMITAEQPDKWPGFLDDEQKEFPALWSLMAAPDATGPAMLENSAPPSAIDRTTNAGSPLPPVLALSSLPTDWQDTAKRLERLHDEDGDESTVSVGDTAAAIANPGAFTPQELDVVRKIDAMLRGRATNTPGHARLEVPSPGTTDNVLYDDRGVRIVQHRTISIEGTRRGEDYPIGSSIPNEIPILTDVSLVVDDVVELTPPAGSTVVIVSPTGGHCVYGGVARLTDWGYCAADVPVAVEIWTGGRRTDGSVALLRPGMISRKATTALIGHVDDELVTTAGAPLTANITSTSRGTAGIMGASYRFRYELSPQTYPGVDASVVASLATPTFALPPARYHTAYGSEDVTFEVYPSGAVSVLYKGTWTRMQLADDNFGRSKLWAIVPDVAWGAPGHYPRRPYLYPDGRVALQTGFPVLTPQNRI